MNGHSQLIIVYLVLIKSFLIAIPTTNRNMLIFYDNGANELIRSNSDKLKAVSTAILTALSQEAGPILTTQALTNNVIIKNETDFKKFIIKLLPIKIALKYTINFYLFVPISYINKFTDSSDQYIGLRLHELQTIDLNNVVTKNEIKNFKITPEIKLLTAISLVKALEILFAPKNIEQIWAIYLGGHGSYPYQLDEIFGVTASMPKGDPLKLNKLFKKFLETKKILDKKLIDLKDTEPELKNKINQIDNMLANPTVYTITVLESKITQKDIDYLFNKVIAEGKIANNVKDLIALHKQIITEANIHTIAGLPLTNFTEILNFFNNNVYTGFFYYTSCYAGGQHYFDPYINYSRNEISKYNYIIASQGITETYASTKDMNFKKFFDDLQSDKNISYIELLSNLNQFLSKSLFSNTYYINEYANIPSLRFPGTDWFSVPNLSKYIIEMTKVKVTIQNKKTFEIQGDKQAMLLYTKNIPFNLRVNGYRFPTVISMKPGDVIHNFAIIEATKLKFFDDIIRKFFALELKSSKYFKIDQIIALDDVIDKQKSSSVFTNIYIFINGVPKKFVHILFQKGDNYYKIDLNTKDESPITQITSKEKYNESLRVNQDFFRVQKQERLKIKPLKFSGIEEGKSINFEKVKELMSKKFEQFKEAQKTQLETRNKRLMLQNLSFEVQILNLLIRTK